MNTSPFYSEPQFNVNYIGNEDMNFDPSKYDSDMEYLSEVQENCKKFGCRAKLFDTTNNFLEGVVYENGTYKLF